MSQQRPNMMMTQLCGVTREAPQVIYSAHENFQRSGTDKKIIMERSSPPQPHWLSKFSCNLKSSSGFFSFRDNFSTRYPFKLQMVPLNRGKLSGLKRGHTDFN